MATTQWRDWLSKPENQKLAANLALGTMSAIGQKGDRDFDRKQTELKRGDSIQEQQRQGYLGRADSLNTLGQTKLGDEFRSASMAAEVGDPFKYKRELQRDTNRAMMLNKAAQMLGMPTSNLFNSMNTDDAILRRNAEAVRANEMNVSDLAPNRSGRDIGMLLGVQSGLGPQSALLQDYVAQNNRAYDSQRQGMVNNTNTAYDQYDKSIAAQMAKGKEIDPATGKPKTSTWRKVLGGVVKYGVPIALAATGVGAPAAAAWMAGASVAGDKIAGKSWKDAAIGGALSAIPGGNLGAGAVGGALTNSVTGGIKNEMLKKVASQAVQQGVRAAGENIPAVGAGLAVANMAMPSGVPGARPQVPTMGAGRPLTQTPQQLYRPQLTQQAQWQFPSQRLGVRF